MNDPFNPVITAEEKAAALDKIQRDLADWREWNRCTVEHCEAPAEETKASPFGMRCAHHYPAVVK